jgi:hypothetical protein
VTAHRQAARGTLDARFWRNGKFRFVSRNTNMSDPLWLFLSLFPSGIGLVLFTYGRKRDRWPQLLAGLGFMVYPWFATTVAALGAVGAALGALLWMVLKLGW